MCISGHFSVLNFYKGYLCFSHGIAQCQGNCVAHPVSIHIVFCPKNVLSFFYTDLQKIQCKR